MIWFIGFIAFLGLGIAFALGGIIGHDSDLIFFGILAFIPASVMGLGYYVWQPEQTRGQHQVVANLTSEGYHFKDASWGDDTVTLLYPGCPPISATLKKSQGKYFPALSSTISTDFGPVKISQKAPLVFHCQSGVK